ncbi:MAG: site-specific integrase [Chromatiales bacterium]
MGHWRDTHPKQLSLSSAGNNHVRWDQVDIARRAITLLETKNNEIRVLPLVGHAFELMEARAKARRIDTGLVFPGRKRNSPIDLRTPFETALKRAGIADFRWHDLRHSAASYLTMNGATLAEIAEVLGHKTLAMVKRYAHLSQAHTTRVVESMNAKIFSTRTGSADRLDGAG